MVESTEGSDKDAGAYIGDVIDGDV